MRNPEQRHLAFECLRLACSNHYENGEQPIEVARRFYEFVTGTGEAVTPPSDAEEACF